MYYQNRYYQNRYYQNSNYQINIIHIRVMPTKTASHGLNCYKQIKNVVRLEVSQRQKNDDLDRDQKYFMELLLLARDGMLFG